MGRLGGQEVTGACKSKAQSGALFRVGSAVVPFLFEGEGKGEERIELDLKSGLWMRKAC